MHVPYVSDNLRCTADHLGAKLCLFFMALGSVLATVIVYAYAYTRDEPALKSLAHSLLSSLLFALLLSVPWCSPLLSRRPDGKLFPERANTQAAMGSLVALVTIVLAILAHTQRGEQGQRSELLVSLAINFGVSLGAWMLFLVARRIVHVYVRPQENGAWKQRAIAEVHAVLPPHAAAADPPAAPVAMNVA